MFHMFKRYVVLSISLIFSVFSSFYTEENPQATKSPRNHTMTESTMGKSAKKVWRPTFVRGVSVYAAIAGHPRLVARHRRDSNPRSPVY